MIAQPSTNRDRKLPPVAEIAVVSICLMLIGGVYQASELPHKFNLTLPVVLVSLGGVLTVADMVIMSRIRPFAWPTFFLVLKWALLGYLILAGILVFTFIRDHTPGSTMAVLIATLFVFAVDVPTILAFTVARFATTASPRTQGDGDSAFTR
ncbi:MAG: hypothetical protein ACRDVP_01720 [Acidimicrobiales bacterium]